LKQHENDAYVISQSREFGYILGLHQDRNSVD